MPKEIYSTRLGTVKVYTVPELVDLLGLPEDDVLKKLGDERLRAVKIKGLWHLPDEVIAEHRKVISRIAAAGARAKKSKTTKKAVKPAIVAAIGLLTLMAAVAILKKPEIRVASCDAPGLGPLVREQIADTPLLYEIKDLVAPLCTEEALSGGANRLKACSDFIKNPEAGITKLSTLDNVAAIEEGESSLFCQAELNTPGRSIPIEFSVGLKEGIADTVTVRLR